MDAQQYTGVFRSTKNINKIYILFKTIASFMGYIKILDILLKYKADPKINDNDGNNALTWSNILNLINLTKLKIFDIFIAHARQSIEEIFNKYALTIQRNNEKLLSPLIYGKLFQLNA
jgi:ankyrin repeat protein